MSQQPEEHNQPHGHGHGLWGFGGLHICSDIVRGVARQQELRTAMCRSNLKRLTHRCGGAEQPRFYPVYNYMGEVVSEEPFTRQQ